MLIYTIVSKKELKSDLRANSSHIAGIGQSWHVTTFLTTASSRLL
jgi:hypothetical protein